MCRCSTGARACTGHSGPSTRPIGRCRVRLRACSRPGAVLQVADSLGVAPPFRAPVMPASGSKRVIGSRKSVTHRSSSSRSIFAGSSGAGVSSDVGAAGRRACCSARSCVATCQGQGDDLCCELGHPLGERGVVLVAHDASLTADSGNRWPAARAHSTISAWRPAFSANSWCPSGPSV